MAPTNFLVMYVACLLFLLVSAVLGKPTVWRIKSKLSMWYTKFFMVQPNFSLLYLWLWTPLYQVCTSQHSLTCPASACYPPCPTNLPCLVNDHSFFKTNSMCGAPAVEHWVKNPTAGAQVTAEARVLSSAQCSGFKDLVLLQLWHRFNAWPGNFYTLQVQPHTQKINKKFKKDL